MKINFILVVLFFILIANSYEGTKKKVEDLFEDYNGDIYSGYLKTLIEGNELFYIYTPSQNDPSNSDVLLWLNGGPGCSSLFGWLAEIGPVTTDNFSGEYKINKYAWNMNLNIFYIEQPAGVGFSPLSDPDFVWNETLTSDNLLAGIKDFFELFPELRDKAFYLSGESYAGVYIPYLVQAILDDPSENKINFKGFLIGNPYTDFVTDDRSLAEYGFWHGIVSIDTYNSYQRNCPHLFDEIRPSIPGMSPDEAGYIDSHNVTKKCNKALIDVANSFLGIDMYGINRPCPVYYSDRDKIFIKQQNSMKKTILNRMHNHENFSGNIGTSRRNLGEQEHEESMWPEYGCWEDDTVDKFLNLNTTKDKLDVQNKSIFWTQCSDIYYNMTESVYFYNTTMPQHKDLKFWIYSGTEDSVCALIGTKRWINKLGFKVKNEWAQWKINDQVAGYDQSYEEGLTIVSIKGAGHMVPQDKREEAKFILDSFLKGIRPSENKENDN